MMDAKNLLVGGAHVPRFIYGTAWKEGATEGPTQLALQTGFRAIDTANQRRHYHEAAVGRGVADAIQQGLVARSDLFLQTKFTFIQGQDDRLPYDPGATIPEQVEQSFASSLDHLETDQIDSYLLHGPTHHSGLTKNDWSAWRAMEAIHDSGQVRLLGVSNFSLPQLQVLCHEARVRPAFVQNRCFATTGWDRKIREFCASEGIVYQAFSLLTANRQALSHPRLAAISVRHNRSPSEIIFRFALEVGMLPLTGTSSEKHMRADLAVFHFQLEPEEVAEIERLVAR
jgi:diketogulonate reductase-like aldo/keto reductase